MKMSRELEQLEEEHDPLQYFEPDKQGNLTVFVPALLADELMEKHCFVTLMDDRVTYVYLDGYYQPLGEVIIKKECKKHLQDHYRKNRAGEVIDYIQASTYIKRREEPPNLLPLKNGVLNMESMELKEHSPEYMFFNKMPVNYDPSADCPEIKKFHREIVGGEDDVTVLEEVTGYTLHRGYVVAKALMLVGGGSNGKSTWLALIRTFLGPQNVSGRGLHELEENRFAKADLFGKYANCCADLPDRALERTGTFKMLTGGDILTAEKKFQHSFNFVNYAKLLFSANKVPEAMDDTDAFFRRWIIITFPNVFNGDACDPYKLDKLVSEQELSGLLNVAIAALKRILKNGSFSHSKTTEVLREEYVRKSSPIASFKMDYLEVDYDAFVEKKSIFNVFAAYCRKNAIPCVTQDTFFKNLPQHVAVTDFKPTVEGRRFTAFKGIRYSDAVSTLSSLSRAFYTLINRGKEFKEPWRAVKLNDPTYIKIEIPLDRVASLDTGGGEGKRPSVSDVSLSDKQCSGCGVTIPAGQRYRVAEQGALCLKCATKEAPT